MGTNYYLETERCPHCGHTRSRRHIGKSSAGWVFALHVYPDDDIKDLQDWILLFEKEGATIVDEYNSQVPTLEMMRIIMCRYRIGVGIKPNGPSWFIENQAELGPMGLARGKIRQGSHGPIAHGAGTWDCYTGYDEETGW